MPPKPMFEQFSSLVGFFFLCSGGGQYQYFSFFRAGGPKTPFLAGGQGRSACVCTVCTTKITDRTLMISATSQVITYRL